MPMKFIDEFRDKDLIRQVVRRIEKSATGRYNFMEVCGGHTAAIRRFAIPSLIPDTIRLISGPGCPVCVTGREFIDRLTLLAGRDDIIITAFGDLLRIPGSGRRTLGAVKSEGADVRVVFSALDSLEIAAANSDKNVVFAGIGFETTAPGTAVTLQQALKSKIGNFFVLSSHKIMPPAMEAVLKDGIRLNGFICPGHVAAITGSEAFRFIPERYGTGCVITGFEPVDILLAISMLIDQVNSGKPEMQTEYGRAVTKSGNLLAQKAMNEVFRTCDAEWRGLGMIPSSGLTPAGEYERYDASIVFPIETMKGIEETNCICSEILRGLKEPAGCRLFGKECTPDNPVGACMVSEEGACNAWYRYSNVYE